MSADEYTQGESRSSVKISTTAAGKPLVEVKIYDGAANDEVDRIRALAVATYRQTAGELGVPL